MKYLITEKQLKTLRKYMKTFINEAYFYNWMNQKGNSKLLFDRLKELFLQLRNNWDYIYRDSGYDDWQYWNRKEDEIQALVTALGDRTDTDSETKMKMTAKELYDQEIKKYRSKY
jgi:hypothetical protein